MANSRKTEKNAIKNFNDIARKCTWIPKRQRRCQKEEYSSSRGKETSNSRRMDEVLQSRAEMSQNKVNGPEDAVASEMIKQSCFKSKFFHHEVLPETLHGSDGSTKFKEDRDPGVFAGKPRRGTKERHTRLQGHGADVGDVEVTRGLCCSSSGKRSLNVDSIYIWEASMAAVASIFR